MEYRLRPLPGRWLGGGPEAVDTDGVPASIMPRSQIEPPERKVRLLPCIFVHISEENIKDGKISYQLLDSVYIWNANHPHIFYQ